MVILDTQEFLDSLDTVPIVEFQDIVDIVPTQVQVVTQVTLVVE